MERTDCRLTGQDMQPGSCAVERDGKKLTACTATLREHGGRLERLIHAVHLSRPENYLSVYQSGCNMTCRKCHSAEFSQKAEGVWMSPEVLLEHAVHYERHVTLLEPRERATAWHAHLSCRCCGACVVHGTRSAFCPGTLDPQAIRLSPQGFGPARNIVAFTGGDLTCRPDYYARCARLIKARTRLWVLIETNGYGLTTTNLDLLQESGVDAFWLDIKAHDPDKHRWLTGCGNDVILGLPEAMAARGFVLEVLSLFIPGLVETDELEKIARILQAVDSGIPFTILAFFPAYLMSDYLSPRVDQMVEAYERVRAAGLENVRLGNTGVFARTERERAYLAAHVDRDAF